MKGLFKNKLLVGVGVTVLLVVLLAASGILKFKVTKTTGGEEAPVSAAKEVGQKQELMSKETTFKGAGGAITLAIKLPVGWRLGSNEKLDLVAGSKLPEKLANGTEFVVNLNVGAKKHPAGVTSFTDYEAAIKGEVLGGDPGLEEVNSFSKKVKGIDAYVLELRNTVPDGSVLHQIQYVFYLDDSYYAIVTASAPDESWDKYAKVLVDSIESLRLVEVVETK